VVDATCWVRGWLLAPQTLERGSLLVYSRGVRSTIAALVCLILAACVAPGSGLPDPGSLLLDSAFQAKRVPANPKLFEASDAMKRYLAEDIAGDLRSQGKMRGLIAALESKAKLKLEYNATITRTAAEAFDARAGNCLSLTVMTAALAQELGLSVSFHRVLAEPLWTRSGDLLFASGHVNIAIGAPLGADRSTFGGLKGIVVDFMPGADLKHQRSQQISERTVTAMYLNNRAAETLHGGQLDEAYWWARGAVMADSRFLEAVNTLGVIYSQHGNPAQAERAFRHVLAIESENVSAMANLVRVLERSGRQAESVALAERLRRIEPLPPFHFFDLGVAALARGDFAKARDLFQQELRRNAYYHEVHFGLAMAYYGLGDVAAAREHLATAQETSTNRDQQDRYAGKLAWLRAQRWQ
jgi:tetratricopeptide (TPR) repeat protein